jgi:hypothetical protein
VLVAVATAAILSHRLLASLQGPDDQEGRRARHAEIPSSRRGREEHAADRVAELKRSSSTSVAFER